MNYLYLILIAIFGGAAWIFKQKADKSGSDAITAKVKGEDKNLLEQQNDKKAELDEVNENIKKLKEERARQQNEQLTDQERADKWNQPKP